MVGDSIEHDRIIRNMVNAIEAHISSRSCTVFGSGVQVLVREGHGDQAYFSAPDVTVSCDPSDRRRGTRLIRSPQIVIEVLSPETEYADRGKKLEAYQTCLAIQEIVFINQFAPSLEKYQRSEHGWSQSFYGSTSLGIDLSSIDVFLAMDEIYKHINFDEPLLEE